MKSRGKRKYHRKSHVITRIRTMEQIQIRLDTMLTHQTELTSTRQEYSKDTLYSIPLHAKVNTIQYSTVMHLSCLNGRYLSSALGVVYADSQVTELDRQTECNYCPPIIENGGEFSPD